ncbi:MAG: M81 family metallopeptidase [Defluviitaleaceae bacterium]|nr:M81 family metallopeptidase [Defluviitaleaceae bacterium]
MKIALAGMGHESNTFNKLNTGLETFFLVDGDEFRQQPRMGSSADGIYQTLLDAKADVVPLFFARAIPSGTVRRDAYEYIKSRILDRLKNDGPWDGVCLALHGSMAVDGVYDPEGDLLEAVRWVVGHEIPVVCALDMHATVTEKMILLSDGFSVYRTAPHIDAMETGVRAAEIMLKALTTGTKPINAFVKIPILVSGEQSETRVNPAKALFDVLSEYDKLDYVLCASYVMGFPWADGPFGGAGALITGWPQDHEKITALTKDMADIFWSKRAEFTYSTPAMSPDEAIQTAMSATAFPVIISDSADNPTAGASQDTTRFLQLMINSGMENAVYTCVADLSAYRLCASKPIGSEISLALGGYYSGKEYERFTVDVKLVNLAEVERVAYAVVQAKGVTFTISNKRCATYSPDTLRALGLEPQNFKIIGIKAGYLSPEYQDISKQSILVLTEGDTALELRGLPYIKTPRPMYPLDLDMKFNGI